MPPFRPFKPGEFVDNGDGTRSTERTITWQLPDGTWVNTPTLFMVDTTGKVLDLSDPASQEQAQRAAMALIRAGYQFPSFRSEPEASQAAAKRSDGGGAFQGSIATTKPALSAPGLGSSLNPPVPPDAPRTWPPVGLYDMFKRR